MNDLLEIQDMSVGYPGKELIRPMSLSLGKGRLTILVGRNGSGKSTLLRTILGAEKALSGNALLQGRRVDEVTFGERSKLVSAVFSGSHFSPGGMKVREMIELGRTPYTGWWGKLSEKDMEVVHQSAKETGVDTMMDRPVGELSDGERQKVLIARALSQQTPLLILDEPMAFLDFSARKDLVNLLLGLSQKGKTIIYSSHDLSLSLNNADEVWAITDNRDLLRQSVSSADDVRKFLKDIFGYQLDQ